MKQRSIKKETADQVNQRFEWSANQRKSIENNSNLFTDHISRVPGQVYNEFAINYKTK